LSLFPGATIQRYVLLFGIPSTIVASLVQEVVKFLIGVVGANLLPSIKLDFRAVYLRFISMFL
jgi:hypothetical protein